MDPQVYIKDVAKSSLGVYPDLNMEVEALREAYHQQLARTGYSNIPRVISVQGTVITMEKIMGITLINYLVHGGYVNREVIIQSLQFIIDKIHDTGITHRDFAPSNIIVDKVGTLWVIDFGESCIKCIIDDEDQGDQEYVELDDMAFMMEQIDKIIAYILLYIKQENLTNTDKLILDKIQPEIINKVKTYPATTLGFINRFMSK